jgi:hypothetical protein
VTAHVQPAARPAERILIARDEPLDAAELRDVEVRDAVAVREGEPVPVESDVADLVRMREAFGRAPERLVPASDDEMPVADAGPHAGTRPPGNALGNR